MPSSPVKAAGSPRSQRSKRLWGSIASLSRSTARKKYKKLTVYFEVGQHVGWPQSSTCEYGDAVTIGQLAESLAAKHVSVSAEMARHFALVLVDAKGQSPSTAIEWSTAACDVDQQMESLNSDLMRGQWQLRLKMLVPPRSTSELKESDPAAFDYYFAQTVNDFIATSRNKLASEDVLHLATILIRHCLLSGDFHAGHITMDLVNSLSQEIGLSKFFPAWYLVHHNRSGKLTGKILTAMNKFCSEQNTPAQCQTRFLEVLGTVDPTLGLVTFKGNGGVASGDRTAGTLVVDPLDGLYFEHQGGRRSAVCSFRDVVAVQAADGDSTAQIVYQGGSGSTEIWEIDVESPVVAETLVVVVDLHRRVLETKDKPVPAASPRVSKKSSKAGVTAAPPAVAAHNAEQEVDDGEVGAANPGDNSVDELSDSSSEEGGDDESDASFMALSETARDSLTLMINDPAKRESWEIPIQQLRITQVLGKGEFGEVQKGLWHYTARQLFEVAVKTVKPKPGFEEQQEEFLQELLDEATLMMRLDHPNIVSIFGIAHRDDMPMIVMELLPLGELKDFVMLQKEKLKGSTLAMQYVCQIAKACEYLHSLNIIHRDLAARNILIKDPVTVKVADFGLSRYCEDVYTIRGQKKMPLKWMAPECINFRRHTKKSDVWMFAVTAWEIMSYGKKPFQTMEVKKYIAEIQRGVRLQKPLGCPQPLYAVMLSCWKYDSGDRPDFTKITGQITAVIGMFPKFVVSDELWERLGGSSRTGAEEPSAPIRPTNGPIVTLRSRPSSPVISASEAGANPFDNDDNDGENAETPQTAEPRSSNPFADEVKAEAEAEKKEQRQSTAPGVAVDIDSDVAFGLGLIFEPIPAQDSETETDRKLRRKARKAAKRAEKLRLAREAILKETGVDPGELDFLALNGGLGAKKVPPPVAAKKPKKAPPALMPKKKPPTVAPKRSVSITSEASVDEAPASDTSDIDDAFAEFEGAEEDEPNNDYSVDLSSDARSQDRKLTFGDSIQWTIFAPKPLANTVDRKDAFSIRCARIVQDQVKLKELGENPDPAVYVPLALKLCTSLEGMIIETRTYLASAAPDVSRRIRVESLAKSLGPRLQTFLESAADAVINYGDASHAILWQDTLKAASMIAVGAVSVCESAMTSRTGSYAMFKPKKNA
eukprot:m.164176 g.164176  ORF g.164176 m.164176 type:complete len:1161 (+) comp14651_c0_seq1:190-3672(+)